MDGIQSLRCLWKCLDRTLQYIMVKFLKSKNLTKQRPCTVFGNHVTFLLPLIKRPIMDGFLSLRCLWNRLDKMLQYIMLKFLKSKNLAGLFSVFGFSCVCVCVCMCVSVTFLVSLNKTANYGQISKFKVSMEAS